MKIGIDCRYLKYEKGGIFRIVHNLLHYIIKFDDGNKYYLVVDHPVVFDFELPSWIELVDLSGCVATRKSFVLTTLLTIPLKLWNYKIDLFISPFYFGPIVNNFVETVVCPWDISFSTHPKHYSKIESIKLRMLSFLSCKLANKVVTCSLYDKNVISKRYCIDDSNIFVLQLAVDDSFRAKCNKSVDQLSTNQLQDKDRFILCNGTIYNRRNIDVFLKAYAEILKKYEDLKLVILGRNYTNPVVDLEQMFQSLRISHSVIRLERVSDEDLQIYYTQALFTYCTSTVDGESLNIKESLALGTPVVVNNNFALTIGSNCEVVEDPTSIDSVVKTLCYALDNYKSMNEKAVKGQQYVMNITWERSFSELFSYLGVH